MKTETRIRHWTPAHARTMAAHFADAGTPNGPSFAAELLRIAALVEASPMEDAYGYARYAAMRVRIGKLAEAYAETEDATERAILDATDALASMKRKLDAEEAAYLHDEAQRVVAAHYAALDAAEAKAKAAQAPAWQYRPEKPANPGLCCGNCGAGLDFGCRCD